MSADSSIAEYYRLGWGLKEIGNICGLNRKTVKRHLVAEGVEIRPSNNVKRSEWLRVKAQKAA